MWAYDEQMSKVFDLYPSNFITMPSFAHSAMLKISKVRLPFYESLGSYKLAEASVKGGFSFASFKIAETHESQFPGDPHRHSFFFDGEH